MPIADTAGAEFDVDGERALLLADHSSIWDREQGHSEYAVKLLNRVQRRLEDLFGHLEWRLFGDGFSVWELAIQNR